ncbi:LPXTG cell wall anchor domain-containing protein [Aestuariimicrobium soli]|uniref:LPXTG cell wall anchor domain-containing protein n=1 Tax=Aestuariimicrobium soli TaxID=2035834 RepID=UPI003EBD46A9
MATTPDTAAATRTERRLSTRLLAAGFAASIALSGGIATLTLSSADAAPISAAAVSNPAETQKAADWIAAQWSSDPSKLSGGLLADAILALVASESHQTEVAAMVAKLKSTAADDAYNAGSAGKIALVAAAVGADPKDFGGVNLIDVITTDLTADPSAGYSFSLALAVLGLARNGVAVPDSALAQVFSQQGTTGAYGYVETWNNNTFVEDPDATAIMIAALRSLGDTPGAADALAKAEAWAVANTTPEGYWTNYSPLNTTGLMAAALADGSTDVTKATAWLKGYQLADGGFGASLDATSSDLMATTQAILGLAGVSYATVELVEGSSSAPVSSAPVSSAPVSSAPVSSAPVSSAPASSGTPSVTITSATPKRPTGLPDTGAEGTPAALWVTLAFGAVAAGALVSRRR